MGRGRATATLIVIAAGVLAATLVAGLVLAGGDGDGDDNGAERLRTDPAAVADFLDAWERSRRGTYVVVSMFRRSVRSGGQLESESVIAQRPPDRLVSEFGSVTGRVDGRNVSCTAGPDERLQCLDDGPAPPYDEDVQDEMGTVEAYVGVGRPRALYVVDQPGDRGCFRLRLAIELPNPPWGEEARYCFDPETGAPVHTEIVRREGSDLRIAVSVRRQVTDEDLEID